MQSQKRPAGMFDKYLKDDSSSGHYVRYEEGDLSDEDLAETAEPIEEDESSEEWIPSKYEAMHHEMMHLMSAMHAIMGMFSEMMNSNKHKGKKTKKSEDDSEY